jgi:hypothetical protein
MEFISSPTARDENCTDIYPRPNLFRGLDLSISESGYLTSDTVSVFEYSNRIFVMLIPNRILSNIDNIIRIRIRIGIEI